MNDDFSYHRTVSERLHSKIPHKIDLSFAHFYVKISKIMIARIDTPNNVYKKQS